MKKIKVPVYNQEIVIDRSFLDDDRFAIVENPPLTLRYNKNTWCLSVLAHECVHLVNFLLANIGQGMPSKDVAGYYDDEYYSYLYATIFDIIVNKTKTDLKEFKHERRGRRSKKMLQHSGE